MTATRAFCLSCWIALAVSSFTSRALAQVDFSRKTESTPDSQPSPRESIDAKRTELATELVAAKRNLESAAANADVTPPAHLAREVSLIESIDLLYSQQLAQLQRLDELRTDQVRLKADLSALRATGPTEEPPDSFLLLESVRSELTAQINRGVKLETARKAAALAVTNARKQSENRERARRQAKEALRAQPDDARVAELAVVLRLAELESRLAVETLALRELEDRNQAEGAAIYELRLSFLKQKVAWIENRAQFTQDDLDEQLVRVGSKELALKRVLAAANFDLDSAVQRLARARQRRDVAEETDQALVEEVEAARLEREAHQLRVILSQTYLQRLALLKQIWNRRFRVFNNQATAVELKSWSDEAEDALIQLDSESRLQNDEAAESRKSLVTLREKLDLAADAGPEVGRWLREQIRYLEKQIGAYESSVAEIETTRRLCERLAAEISGEVERPGFSERLAALGNAILTVWRYELAAVDDKPITVSKIVVGILLLVVGMSAARFASRFLGRRLLPRVGLDQGAAAAIQSLLFYVLVLTLGLVSLRIVNVPLTAFTIVGGALAIGVGFGSQNLINNFISGLILLMERPIRVGDLIEIGAILGLVEHIGPRSTRVRSADNVDIIVPNSTFLEKNVVNWTLSDDRYRAHVTIGLAYGSPTREAAKLIRRAVEEHGKTLKTPKAIVLFTEFGDNALVFEVHFWLRMRRIMDRKIVESDIRYRVDTLFREAGIVIAFPQRDIHFDAAKPVEVRLLPDQPSSTASQKEDSVRSRLKKTGQSERGDGGQS